MHKIAWLIQTLIPVKLDKMYVIQSFTLIYQVIDCAMEQRNFVVQKRTVLLVDLITGVKLRGNFWQDSGHWDLVKGQLINWSDEGEVCREELASFG